jgi:hypothetical protein
VTAGLLSEIDGMPAGTDALDIDAFEPVSGACGDVIDRVRREGLFVDFNLAL